MKSIVILSLQVAVAVSEAGLACKLLPGDPKWPAVDVWKNALPGVVALEKSKEESSPRRPDYQLVATTTEQVQAAVKFSAEKNVRLTILNSGVDFLGRSDGPSGLSLMVGNLKGVRISDSFVPSTGGVPNVNYTADPIATVNVVKIVPGKQAFVTFGAGVSGHQLNNALAKSGLFTMAAADTEPKVVGGYTQTGGHGPFTNKYGLGADNVVEYKVITADGKLRIANAVSEPDLFWALRGGGGGTFGVVVEATMKAYPAPKITMTRWYLKTIDANDTKSIYEPAAYALSQMPLLSQQYGVQGYFFLYPSEIWVTMLLADEQSGVPAATKAWQPIIDKMATFKGVQKPIQIHTNFPNFKSWFEALFGSLEPVPNKKRDVDYEFARHFRRHASELEDAYPRGIIPMDSRLLSQAHLADPNLAQALHDAMPQMDSGMLRGHLTAGGRVNKPVFDAISPENAVNPSWRKAYIHLIGTGGGVPDISSVKKISPDAGCYANECMYKETSFKEIMFGAPYARLESIKNKYDPNGLFWVSPGIGADKFTADAAGRVCPVGASKVSEVSKNGQPPLFDNRNMGAHTVEEYKTGPATQEAADKESKETQDKIDAAIAKAIAEATAKAKGISSPAPIAPPAVALPVPKSSAPAKPNTGGSPPKMPVKGIGKGTPFATGKVNGGSSALFVDEEELM